jgi:hypothetical protein
MMPRNWGCAIVSGLPIVFWCVVAIVIVKILGW